MHNTLPLLEVSDFPSIKRKALNTLQVNLGYKCNLRCLHCHVNASPERTEMMSRELVELIVPVMQKNNITTLDVTGGAPELHDDFRYLVSQAVAAGIHVIDRCNLTVLFEPGQEGLANFLAENNVEVVASLPCYSLKNVDQQRGDGVFDKSIRALQQLNRLDYGKNNTKRKLSLVYNPQGAVLPPPQKQLQQDYKQQLFEHFSIEFDQLFSITNMPIKRFGSTLVSKGQFSDYMTLLKDNYKAENLSEVMCRSMVSVDWQGYLYDCDFNQMLDLPVANKSKRHLKDLLNNTLQGEPIVVADHCFGCTAGQGSSCAGALDE